jgi:hypothetical protein
MAVASWVCFVSAMTLEGMRLSSEGSEAQPARTADSSRGSSSRMMLREGLAWTGMAGFHRVAPMLADAHARTRARR